MNKRIITLLIHTATSKKINILYILFLFFIIQTGYSQEKIILKNADKLQGETINGESVRKASGNVQFTQGNVDVYCNSATQYLTSNRVELIGNVKIYQDTLSLFTNKAVYFGNERRAICEGVTLYLIASSRISLTKGRLLSRPLRLNCELCFLKPIFFSNSGFS